MVEFQNVSSYRLIKVIKIIQSALLDQEIKSEKLNPIPSLFMYYNLLPEFARNHPIIIQTVRCLEFARHDLTIQ